MLSFTGAYRTILEELSVSLGEIREEDVENLLVSLLKVEQVFVAGAGRMGVMLSAFSMRLNHLGIPSSIAGEINCPPISESDLLLVASSSGETPTIREIVRKAAGFQAAIVAITAEKDSSIARMAQSILHIRAPSALEGSKNSAVVSKQPMKTLFEQSLFVVLESLVLVLMEKTGQTPLDLVRRHANLE